jgi:hypothetical protein
MRWAQTEDKYRSYDEKSKLKRLLRCSIGERPNCREKQLNRDKARKASSAATVVLVSSRCDRVCSCPIILVIDFL